MQNGGGVQARGRLKIVVAITALAVLAVGLWLGLRPVEGNPAKSESGTAQARSGSGGSAPPFELPSLAGTGNVSRDELEGSPYVLNFWATWCGPCRTEMPAFEKIWRKYKDRGVVVVGVNINDDPDDARDFARELGITYPLVVDENDELATELGVKGLPQTFFVDSTGGIVGSGATLGLVTEGELSKTIEDMLEGRG